MLAKHPALTRRIRGSIPCTPTMIKEKRSKMIRNWIKVGQKDGKKSLVLARSKHTGKILGFYDREPSEFYDIVERIDLTSTKKVAR